MSQINEHGEYSLPARCSDAGELAEKIISALAAQGYGAKLWDRHGGVRVYVSRGTRPKDQMGYVEVMSGDSVECHFTANRAGMTSRVDSIVAD